MAELYKQGNVASREYDDAFFVDDSPQAQAPEGFRLVDFGGLLVEASEHDVVCAICIGEPRVRRGVA